MTKEISEASETPVMIDVNALRASLLELQAEFRQPAEDLLGAEDRKFYIGIGISEGIGYSLDALTRFTQTAPPSPKSGSNA